MARNQQPSWTVKHGVFVAIDWFGGDVYYAMTATGELYRYRPEAQAVEYIASFTDSDKHGVPEEQGYFADLSARGSGLVRAITSAGYVYWCNPNTKTVGRAIVDFKSVRPIPAET